MKVAIQGCCHGCLDEIYATLQYMQETHGTTVDLLIICGDFQSIRNTTDLASKACPPKYRQIGTFYEYYTGIKTALVPTLFIGGNHEASNYLWELYHGGWVCPNIYFLGFAGCVRFGGLRIAGLSGIYKQNHYNNGFHERQPFNEEDQRSIYHVRVYNVCKLAQLTPGSVKVFLSHDWPLHIERYGNTRKLIATKRHFAEQIARGELGSGPSKFLMEKLQPDYWFAAHMHVKFAAIYPHIDKNQLHKQNQPPVKLNPEEITIDFDDLCKPTTRLNHDEIVISDTSDNEVDASNVDIQTAPDAEQSTTTTDQCQEKTVNGNSDKAEVSEDIDMPTTTEQPSVPELTTTPLPRETKFLALNKCLPGLDFIQILDIDTDDTSELSGPPVFSYDPEWLAIVRATDPLFSHSKFQPELPSEQEIKSSVEKEREWVKQNIPKESLIIPTNFVQTAIPYDLQNPNEPPNSLVYLNPQTVEFCNLLQIPNRFNPNGIIVPAASEGV